MTRKPDLQIPGPLGRRQRPWRALWLRTLLPPLTLIGVVLSRGLDLTLALLLLIPLAPLLAVRGLIARVGAGRVFIREPLIGRFRAPFERLWFAGNAPGQSLAVLLNILRGDMAIAGPRPLTAHEAARVDVEAAVRFTVRPGVFSPYRLKSRTGVAYAPETQIDSDYAYGQSARGDAGLVVRSLIGEVLGGARHRPRPCSSSSVSRSSTPPCPRPWTGSRPAPSPGIPPCWPSSTRIASTSPMSMPSTAGSCSRPRASCPTGSGSTSAVECSVSRCRPTSTAPTSFRSCASGPRKRASDSFCSAHVRGLPRRWPRICERSVRVCASTGSRTAISTRPRKMPSSRGSTPRTPQSCWSPSGCRARRPGSLGTTTA
ncbi:hypothetical protein THIOKS12070053 [Thiocapsa sp. KS1]|nr:hypothetical protein THIOKS12070053 [Thiocapsa sp. KS1]